MSGANASTDSGENPVQSRESNTRRDNPRSKTRKTRRIQARKKYKQGEDLPVLHIESFSIQRSGSQSSLFSLQSAGSYKSAVIRLQQLYHAVEVDKEIWKETVVLRREQALKIVIIKGELSQIEALFFTDTMKFL